MTEITLHCSCGATWTSSTAGRVLKSDPIDTEHDREYGYYCHTCGKEIYIKLPMPDVQVAVGPEAIDEVLSSFEIAAAHDTCVGVKEVELPLTADGCLGSDEWEEP
jgi:hypothetical protein